MSQQYNNKQAQIVALEIKLGRMISSNSPPKQIFAIKGLIAKLKKQEEERKNNDWLAQ